MSIEVRNLSHIYGEGTIFEQYALKNVNLTIGDGEFIGLIGHTGSGKSTLIQHLNGLLRASSGDILYNGESIYREGYSMKELRSHVGWFSSIRSISSLRWMYFRMCALAPRIWDCPKRRLRPGQERL